MPPIVRCPNLFLFVLGVVIAAGSKAQVPEDFDKTWKSVAKQWHELVEEQGIVGSSLGFFQGDKVLAHEVHGHGDLHEKRKVDRDTIYHWASITKTFTGIAIMQLRDRGRLKLSDPIVKYLPVLRKVHNPFGEMEDITLRHLLSHMSGFRGATWPWKNKPWHPHEPTEWSQLVAMLPYTEIGFKPGSRYSYSNPGIIFLGQVIEQLSGDDIEVYVDKNILKPLGMVSTYFDHTPYHLLKHRSNNYSYKSGKDPVPDGKDFDTGITVSNGGLNAPVPDMLRYLRFLVGSGDTEAARAVLSRSSLEEMWTSQQPKSKRKESIGLAWFLTRTDGRTFIGHTGGQKSFSSFIYFHVPSQTGCIAAFNTTPRGGRSAFGTARTRIFDEVFPLFDPKGEDRR